MRAAGPFWLAVALGAALACGPGDAPAEFETEAGVGLPEPAEPIPEVTPGAVDAPTPAAGAPERTQPRAPEPDRSPQSPDAAALPLEDLLRLPAASEPDSPTAVPLTPVEAPPENASPDELAAWRERIRIERRSQAVGPAGPRQGTYSETDAGVSLPVGERVRIEGGVRVGAREEPGREPEEDDRQSSSRVGVEVRF